MNSTTSGIRKFVQNYKIEVIAGGIAVAGNIAIYWLLVAPNAVWKVDSLFVAAMVTGISFLAGQMYSRIKERRDAKRKRAQDLFLEWHSKDIRESRIYVSRWLKVRGGGTIQMCLPSLGEIEQAAANSYENNYLARNSATPESVAALVNVGELDDPEKQELHFFRIYQFFERWSLLIEHDDIDNASAISYMSSYTGWYRDKFICSWAHHESDAYIKASLEKIIRLCFGGVEDWPD